MDDGAADDGAGAGALALQPVHRDRRGAACALFAGAFAIFGHGNVTCLAEALEAVQDDLPTWRGQNEQSMALAAMAFAKARRRRQIMVAISSIGPGALNMTTAAAAAHANRLPVLFLSGDVFASRRPDPVLQQVEHFGNPDHLGQRRLPGGDPLLGPHHPSRADHFLAAAGARHDARSRRLRTGLPRPLPGYAGNRLRLPGRLLRADAPHHPPPAPGPRPARGGGRAAADRATAADHRRRRRALFASGGGACRFRRRARDSARRDHRRQGQRGARPSRPCRPDRRDRIDLRQCAGRRGGRDPRRGHAAAGLHHRVLDGLLAGGPVRLDQRRALGCDQASRAGGGRGRARDAGRTRRRAGRLARGCRLDGAGTGRIRRLEPVARQPPGADQRARADLCPGGRGGEPQGRPARSDDHRRRRAARRDHQGMAGEIARHVRLRVRLLQHGLRDRRRLGRGDGRYHPARPS